MKILNFGSLNLDHVYEVDHFVRKGETLTSQDLKVFCGGKGLNQSLALRKAGLDVWHAGVIGADGGILLDLLKSSGVDCSLVRQVDSLQTGSAIIQNDRMGDNCILLYSGANRAVDPQMVDEVLSHFSPGDYVLLQNEISCLDCIMEKAHRSGLRIVLNPSPIDENLMQLDPDMVDLLILNEIEAQALAGRAPDPQAQLDALAARYRRAEIVLTLGEDGSLYAGPEGRIRQNACRVPQVVDTTAAGDTFTGYFLAERLRGSSAAQALRIASQASAIAVTRKGAAASIPTLEEVKNFSANSKI